MLHPYRIIVTSAGSRYLRLALVIVRDNAALPTRIRHPQVAKVLAQVQVPDARRHCPGICMPPRPLTFPFAYDIELAKLYRRYDTLVSELQEQSA